MHVCKVNMLTKKSRIMNALEAKSIKWQWQWKITIYEICKSFLKEALICLLPIEIIWNWNSFVENCLWLVEVLCSLYLKVVRGFEKAIPNRLDSLLLFMPLKRNDFYVVDFDTLQLNWIGNRMHSAYVHSIYQVNCFEIIFYLKRTWALCVCDLIASIWW